MATSSEKGQALALLLPTKYKKITKMQLPTMTGEEIICHLRTTSTLQTAASSEPWIPTGRPGLTKSEDESL